MALKGTKNPALSVADSVRDRAQAKTSANMKAAGVSQAEMAGNEHLMQSKHFGATSQPKDPAGSSPRQHDGMAGMAKAMGKRFIGG